MIGITIISSIQRGDPMNLNILKTLINASGIEIDETRFKRVMVTIGVIILIVAFVASFVTWHQILFPILAWGLISFTLLYGALGLIKMIYSVVSDFIN